MRGKILGAGVISGDDGKRYYYDEGELKNAKANQKLEGAEVDFEVKDDKAVGVFITKTVGFSPDFSSINTNLPVIDNKFVFLNLNEALSNLTNANIHSIKVFGVLAALISLLIAFVYSPEFEGFGFWFFALLQTAALLWAMFNIGKLAQNHNLLKFYAISIVSTLLFIVFIRSAVQDSIAAAFMGESQPWFQYILCVIFIIAAIVYAVRYVFFLGRVTKEKCFVWSFYLALLCIVFIVIDLIGVANQFSGKRGGEAALALAFTGEVPHTAFYDLSLIAAALCVGLHIFAWLRFREIKNDL